MPAPGGMAQESLRRLWLGIGALLVLLVIYLSLTPVPPQLIGSRDGDKLGHVLAYLVLMSWFANLYEGRRARLVTCFSLIVLGIFLEYAQRWLGTRSFEVADMLAGAAGVGLAWVLMPPRLPNYLRLAELTWRAIRRA